MSDGRDLLAFLNPKRHDDPLSLGGRRLKRVLVSSAVIGLATFNVYHFKERIAPGQQQLSIQTERVSRDQNGKLTFDVIAVSSVVFLTSGTSFSRPVDWNDTNNSIEGIGGGAGGRPGTLCFGGAGGEGGGYAKIVNQTLAGSTAYAIGAGGAINGNGGNTTFINSATLLARGGNTAATQVGATTRLGGAGGARGTGGAGGGGGAGGPNAAGVVGAVGVALAGGAGGRGDGTFGGTGGAGGPNLTNGSPGNPGAEYTATAGGTAGSGGGGGGAGASNVGGAGALYGGAGGGGGKNGAGGNGGLGAQGLIIITNLPLAPCLMPRQRQYLRR